MVNEYWYLAKQNRELKSLVTKLRREKEIELKALRAERDAAVKDILHRCYTCGHSLGSSGKECDSACYVSGNIYCQSWEWRGLSGL